MTPELQQIRRCDDYLGARTGKYEWRAIRYRAALEAMQHCHLNHSDTIFDVGAGWTEFDYCLRTEGDSRARYIPVDGCIDGIDLNKWEPPRDAEFFVALELLEHLYSPARMIRAMQERCSKAIIISTPNPMALGEQAIFDMDETHVRPIWLSDLILWGFQIIEQRSFYGQPNDSLFGVWRKEGV